MPPPNNRMIKPRQPKMTTQTLLDFDLGESSSDSDFRIEDHDESDDDFSDGSKGKDSGKEADEDNKSGDDDEDEDSDAGTESTCSDLKHLFEDDLETLIPAKQEKPDHKDVLKKMTAVLKDKLPTKPICCVCLGDRSDDANEIIECDSCSVFVHEGCYGVSDTASISSTTSSCSTEPWFCEACRAGVTDPSCELCPNKGGIFKETDVGKWVHLVCALYVPGVAFGEVDQLSSVTLFEMQYSKWGAKTCTLCENDRFARTGVCIGCDAGMCKTFFHVTCAQAAGFLSEAHSEEADHADPFYAHCKVHSDKTMIKHRKRNFNTIKLIMEHKLYEKSKSKNDEPTPAKIRIQRKLAKYQNKYRNNKMLKIEPWVPTQKISRLLTTSATACKRLLMKAEIMDVDIAAMELQEAQISALTDIRKKWHIAPAFSVEFIGYYLDRISRTKELKASLDKMVEENSDLLQEQDNLKEDYDKRVKINTELKAKHDALQSSIRYLHKQIETLCPNKTLPSLQNIGRPVVQVPNAVTPPARPMSVPTAAALKMGVGFPLAHLPGTKDDTGRILSTQSQSKTSVVRTHDCGICKRCNDQHLLAKCDTCHLHYHLGCLNPPLTRHPKKSKLYGWQCSECDKSDESDAIPDIPKGPRKSRTRFSKDGTIVPVDQSISNSNPDISLSPMSSPVKRKSMDARPSGKQTAAKKVYANKSFSLAQDTSNSSIQQQQVNKNKKSRKKSETDLIVKKSETERSLLKKGKVIGNSKLLQNPTVLLEDALKGVGSHNKLNASTPKTCENQTIQITITNALPDEPSFIPVQERKINNEIGEMDPLEDANDPLAVAPPADVLELLSHSMAPQSTDIEAIPAKQNRKKRKDKHKSKYGSSDNEKSSTKEHKRKRKKKNHDHDSGNPNDSSTVSGIPKIKIKFKTLPLPGEVAPEAQFFYVSADMVRSAKDTSRPTSVETVDGSPINTENTAVPFISSKSSPVTNFISPNKGPQRPLSTSLTTQKLIPVRQSSPRKPTKRKSTGKSTNAGPSSSSSTLNQVHISVNCCVCNEPGTVQNVVTCDECRKHYHFTCLDPPLKKTPKRRGYSWHCADCDPTDNEL